MGCLGNIAAAPLIVAVLLVFAEKGMSLEQY